MTTTDTVSARKSTLRPYRGRLLAEPVDAETQTAAGIIIPENCRKQGEEYIIRAIGAGDLDESNVQWPITDLFVGDHIVLNKYTGTEITWWNGEMDVECIVVRPSEIIAVLD